MRKLRAMNKRPRAQGMRTANHWFGALPSQLASTPPMDAVERLGGFPAPPSHSWLPAIRTIEPLGRTEVFCSVIHVRCFILLLVAHDAFPFRVHPKIIRTRLSDTRAQTGRPVRRALYSASV